MDALEEDLKIASKILEWEMGDIWGHVGVRLPENKGIGVKLFRPPEDDSVEDWLVYFDHSLRKLSGVGQPPFEATIYTEIFNARADVNAIAHCHAPMCITLSLVNRTVGTLHMQSKVFSAGVPMFPRPIYITDDSEGRELAQALGQSVAVVIRGHGIVTVGADVKEACMYALYLERTAKMQAIAHALGFQGSGPEFLREINDSWTKLAAKHGVGDPRRRYSAEWRYYKRKVQTGELWTRGWV
jgi:ribulose-5-phosphate 4-epimerase/fuculose-1-phosphate aldolase